jgi:hypothetical protein
MYRSGTIGKVLLGAAIVATTAGAATAPAAAGTAGVAGLSAQTQPSLQQQEVASVSRAGLTLTFLREAGPDGRPRIQVVERGTISGPASPLPALIGQRLTSQEIYLALAPRGAVAPAALASQQATEAAELGRDAKVRVVQAAAAAPVGAIGNSVATCQTHVYADISDFAGVGLWSNKSGTAYPSGNQFKYVGGLSSYETTNFVGFGACNESNSPLTVSYAINQRFNNLGWQQSGTVPVGQGGYVRWWYKYYKTVNGVTRGTSYQVKGSSNGAFDLVTGEWFTI